MFFKMSANKKQIKVTTRVNKCLLLRRYLQEMLEEKNSYMYGNPIWVNSSLLVDEWNARIDDISKEIPEFKDKLQKIKGYSVFGLPEERKIPFDQISRGNDGKVHSYVTSERTITVLDLYKNREEADWKFYTNNYETWKDISDWQCSYANKNWPWITYLVSQCQCTIPQMEKNMNALIKELDEEISKLKKQLIYK